MCSLTEVIVGSAMNDSNHRIEREPSQLRARNLLRPLIGCPHQQCSAAMLAGL